MYYYRKQSNLDKDNIKKQKELDAIENKEENKERIKNIIEENKREKSYESLQYVSGFLRYKYPHLDLSTVFNTKGEIANISVFCKISEQDSMEIRRLMYDLNEFKDNYPQYSKWIEMGMPKSKNYYCKIRDKFGVEYKVVDTNKGFYPICFEKTPPSIQGGDESKRF